jgi:secreted protein with Ig-like and vWFA domain
LKACNLGDRDKQEPVNVIVALDMSGSMEGKKLFLCQMILQLLLCQLTPDNHFRLVLFSEDAIIEIPDCKVTTINKQLTDKTIQSLGTQEMTNLSTTIGLVAPRNDGCEVTQ